MALKNTYIQGIIQHYFYIYWFFIYIGLRYFLVIMYCSLITTTISPPLYITKKILNTIFFCFLAYVFSVSCAVSTRKLLLILYTFYLKSGYFFLLPIQYSYRSSPELICTYYIIHIICTTNKSFLFCV